MGFLLFATQKKGNRLISPRSRLADWLQKHRDILPPTAVGIALRLVLMLAAFTLTGTTVMTQGDTSSYLQPGLNLILHGAYAANGLPEIDRTPGYPIFLVLSGMLFNNALLVVTIQIALSLISLLLVRNIARKTFPGSNAATVAAWLYACEPISILYTSRLMPETLFVLLILAMIDRLLAFYASSKLSTLALAALMLVAATYVRPVSYYLVLPLALALTISLSPKSGLRWKAPILLLIVVIPLLAAWQMRNRLETGYSGFSSTVEQNLYFFQSAEITAELNHQSLPAMQQRLGYPDEASYLFAHPEQRHWTQSQRLHYMHTEAVRVLSQNRLLYLKSHLTGVAIVAFTPCAAEFLELINAFPSDGQIPARIINEGIFASIRGSAARYPGMAAVKVLFELYLLPLYILAIRGIIGKQGIKLPIFTLTGIALYFLIISGGAQAVGRYRSPVMPELCIFAAGGCMVFRKQRKGEAKSLRPALMTL